MSDLPCMQCNVGLFNQIGHWISILVCACFEQGVMVAPKGIADYGETRMVAVVLRNVATRLKGT